jgi:putative ABC transport system permease protein
MTTIRSLFRVPAFSTTVIATFAIATAVVAATFALVWHILVRQMPFPDAERLVFVWNRYGVEKVQSSSLSAPDFNDRRKARAFESSAMWQERGVNLNAAEPQRLNAILITDEFFRVLRVSAPPLDVDSVILTDSAWHRLFGARRDLVGQTIVLNDRPRRVAAVLPAGFAFPSTDADVFLPLRLEASAFADAERGNEYYSMIARLRPGVSLAQAQAEMDVITRAVINVVPDRTSFLKETRWHVDVFSMRTDLVRRARAALLMLFGAGVLVMLLATANVMGLFIARTASREKEIGVRQALGANRTRIAIELASEAIALACFGTLIGIVLARLAMPFIAETHLPRIEEVRIDAGVIAFALAASMLMSLCIGAVISAWAFRRRTTLTTDRANTASAGTTRLRSILVAAQIAIAVMLLSTGTLLVESYRRLRQVDTGFDSKNMLTFRIELPRARYQPPQLRAFFNDLQSRLGALPSVESSAVVTDLPFSPSDWNATFDVPGFTASTPSAHFRVTIPGYIKTMRIPLLRGRDFTANDREGTAEVALIDDVAAKRYWPNENPIGQHLDFNDRKGIEIIGVVGSIRENALDSAAEPHVYFSEGYRRERAMFGVVRTRGDAQRVAADVRAIVRSLDPAQPIFAIRTMEDYLDEAVAQPRLRASVVALSATVAVLLSLIGLYGLTAYIVTSRTREVGVRMALGATAARIGTSVIAWALRVSAFGVVFGIAGAIATLRSIQAFFFGVDSIRTGTLIAVAIGFLCTALAASVTPALRAARVDPATALRHE